MAPKQKLTKTVSVRLPRQIIESVDRVRSTIHKAIGIRPSRSAALRAVLERGIEEVDPQTARKKATRR